MKTERIRAVIAITAVLLCASFAVAEDHAFIEGPINSGPEATKTCLECHEDVAGHIMKTSHWTWDAEQTINGKKVKRGKINSVNNFCVSVRSNEPRCTSCHIGYGWEDDSFDFNNTANIDCLVCHDTTGTYKKIPTGAGMPAEEVDLTFVARNVGKSSRQSCGSCHFFGGGGDAVKHGDLDSSLDFPDRTLDVHMASDGNNFTCADCHETQNHNILGHAMVVSPKGEQPIGCTGCHGDDVHGEWALDMHTDTVACQTCHIPTFAKEVPTKIAWDWSTSGQNIKGENDKYGKPTYAKKKGTFTWGKNIVPEYAWYNGSADAYQLGDKINPEETTLLSYPLGNRKDKKAKIYPFKSHTGKQIYDVKNKYLITPKVFGGKGDQEAYWKTFDWDKATRAGMKANGLEYSGEYGFAPTKMYWRINHMVTPKEEALGCLDCHGNNGRLDWKALGYKGDPLKNPKYARTR